MEHRKKKVTDVSKETGIPKDRIYKWLQQGNNPKAEDEKKLEEWIKGQKSEKVPTLASSTEPTPMQILAVLADAFNNQTLILKSIESKMARADAQATIKDTLTKIDANLTETLTGVEFVSRMQLQEMLALLSELRARKKVPSLDARKKPGGNGGDGHRSGIKP